MRSMRITSASTWVKASPANSAVMDAEFSLERCPFKNSAFIRRFPQRTILPRRVTVPCKPTSGGYVLMANRSNAIILSIMQNGCAMSLCGHPDVTGGELPQQLNKPQRGRPQRPALCFDDADLPRVGGANDPQPTGLAVRLRRPRPARCAPSKLPLVPERIHSVYRFDIALFQSAFARSLLRPGADVILR